MKQVRLIISGTVQGVGFRQYIKWAARKNSVVGRTWNRTDGRVEAILQPSEGLGQKGLKKVEVVIKLVRKGPPISKVSNVEMRWEEASEQFDDFRVEK